jgi:hypothetical protein
LKRIVKEAISGFALVISSIGLLSMFFIGPPNYNNHEAIFAIILIVVALLSMAALVTYSRTGWSIEGFDNEWDAARILSPSESIFLSRNPNQETRTDEISDQKKDDEYYDHRSRL